MSYETQMQKDVKIDIIIWWYGIPERYCAQMVPERRGRPVQNLCYIFNPLHYGKRQINPQKF